MDFLEKIANLFSPTRREGIQNILNSIKNNPDATSRQLEFDAKRLFQKSSTSKKIFNPLLVQKDNIINSIEHNDNMESVYLDLLTLYRQIDILESTQIKQLTSISDDFLKTRAAIFKLINDARVFYIRNQNPEFDDIKLIDFNIANNRSSKSPSAQIDNSSRLLKLPAVIQKRVALERRGGKITQTEVEIIGGKKGSTNSNFTSDKALDVKNETFWVEIIYSDIPIKTIYTSENGNVNINGPIVKYKLKFSANETINQIKIFPFSNHPLKIIDVRYKPSNKSEGSIPIPDFIEETSLDWIEYNFEPIFTNQIEVVFTQENYRNLIITIPKYILYATDFLMRLKEERAKELAELPNLDNVEAGGFDALYNEALKDLSKLLNEKTLEKNAITEIDLAGKTILSIAETLGSFSPSFKTLIEEISNYTDTNIINDLNSLEKLIKYEYLIGAREIECNYNIYSPVGYYESERFEPKTTVTEVRLVTQEKHPSKDTLLGPFRETSTEWEIEFSQDRKIPIFPYNFITNGQLQVVNEKLQIDHGNNFGITRFPVDNILAAVRENQKYLGVNIDYTLQQIEDNRLKISINNNIFNKKNIYTIDYFASSGSANIDVLNTFIDKKLSTPNVFQDTGPRNEIKLEKYPYVDYNIINNDNFSYIEDTNGYIFSAPIEPYKTGMVLIFPTWLDDKGVPLTTLTGTLSVSGVSGIYSGNTGTPNWSGSLSGVYTGSPYAYYLKINKLPAASYEVASWDLSSPPALTLKNVPTLYTGIIGNEIDSNDEFIGNVLSGGSTGYIKVEYSLDVVYSNNGNIFGLDTYLYEPISVTIGGTKASNITSYDSIEQPAFNAAIVQDNEYEYIHDGKVIYFNQPINNKEILVDYRWITEYIKVNCILRSNKLVNTTITPVVDEYQLLINTTLL